MTAVRENVSTRSVPSHRRLVVIADDNDGFRSRISNELRDLGYAILEARDGLETLGILRDIRPDALITDLEMPELDGLGVCRTLRELRAFDSMPLILCTAAPRDDDRVVATKILVGTTIVQKPVEAAELAAIVEDLLDVPMLALRGWALPAGARREASAAGR